MGVTHFTIGTLMAASAAAQDAPVAPSTPPRAAEPAEIVVTGERVSRTVKDTASSVAVFNQQDIENSSANRVEQLFNLVPNVTTGTGSQGPSIRGLDTTGALQALPAFLGGNRPRTTLVVDGRRQTYNEFVFSDAPLWDLDRIEIFRTPQTTTQGQNSIAGAIFVYSNDPTFEWEGRARLIGGNLKTRQASAMVSGPVSSEVALRVSGDLNYSKSTSWIRDVMAGADPNHKVYGQVRSKLLFLPKAIPDARISLTYVHLESQSPQIEPVTIPFKRRRDGSPSYGIFGMNVDTLTASLRYQLGPTLVANAWASAGDSSAQRFAIPGFGESRNEGRDWSAETVLNWGPRDSVDITAGVSHSRVRLRQRIDLSVFSGIGRFRDVQDGTGLFGQADFRIVPQVTLSAGLRYQQDRQQRVGALEIPTSAIPLDYDRTFRAWLPKVSIAYDVNADVRVGALVQRAYNPGGTTLRFDTGAPDDFAAETLWNYEAFGRASFLDGALNLSANVFYNDIRDAQRSKTIIILAPNGFGVGFADLFNVPRSRVYGAELEARLKPVDRLEIRAGAGMLRTKIERSGTAAPEYSGKEFARSPHFTGMLAIDWQPRDHLTFSATLRHSDNYWSDDENIPARRIRAFTTVDLRAEWKGRNWSVFGYARNASDDFYLTYLIIPSFGTAGDPREVGLGIDRRF
jgi:iron complex outermembrane receptor protein